MQNNTFFGHSDFDNLIVLEETASTNDYLKEHLSKVKPLKEHTAIMAINQTQGRGQRGSTWISKPGENLTISVLLQPDNLPVQSQFYLTVIASLAIFDTLCGTLQQHLKIKWPNDIMFHDKKIAGMLIENTISANKIKHSIIGLGLNIFQKEFSDDIKQKTTSIILEEPTFKSTIIDIANQFRNNLKKYALLLEEQNYKQLLAQYNSVLFRRGLVADFIVNNHAVKAEIVQVGEDGLLEIVSNNSRTKYDLKHIVYQL